MKASRLTRFGTGVVALAAAAAALASPLLNATPAFALGSNQGAATLTPTSGQSGTTFTMGLPSGASCPGDSTNSGYRWQTYMVPSTVDPATLQFGSAGPTGTGNHPLFDTAGNPVVNEQTQNQTTSGGPGLISGIPNMNYSVYTPGQVPAGVYNIGIACTLGGPSSTQESSFWVVQITVTSNGSATAGTDPAAFNWQKGARPQTAPTLNTVTPANGTLTAAFTPTAADPALSGFTVTATPHAGGTAVTQSGTASPITVSGLTNNTLYDVTVHETNSIGSSAESNVVQGTPAHQAVTNLAATPAPNAVGLTWTAPPTSDGTPTGYLVHVGNPNSGPTPPADQTVTTTSANVTPLTPGIVYQFVVTPTYTSPDTGTSASVNAAALSNSIVMQDITVTRPTGALVLTQICGVNGALAAETAQLGWGGGLPAVAATANHTPGQPDAGTAPFLDNNGVASTTADPQFSTYPYPTDANGVPDASYPTHCGINLGIAQFVRSGPGAGQFFAASGPLNQVTVVNTRDSDTAWTLSGRMSAFNAAGGKTFSGSELGWSPVRTYQTPPFADSSGNVYTMTTAAGTGVAPNTPNATGLSTGGTLGSAAARAGTAGPPSNYTGGLGTAVFDARLKLLIPVTAQSGTYTGTLTLSAV